MPKAKASATIAAVEKEMTPDIIKKPAIDLNGYDKNPNAAPVLRIGGVEIDLKVCEEPPMFHHRSRYIRSEREFGYYEGDGPLGEQVIYESAGKVGTGIYLTKGSVLQIDSADADPCLIGDDVPKGVLLVDGSWIKTDRLNVRPGASAVVNSKIICEKNLVLQKASITKVLSSVLNYGPTTSGSMTPGCAVQNFLPTNASKFAKLISGLFTFVPGTAPSTSASA
jgi:hypothetical protein